MINKNILINNQNFKVCDNENINENIELFKQVISLLKKLSKIVKKSNIIFYNITHGGYIPINCSDTFNNIFIFNEDIVNNHNIICNLYTHSIQNISILYECFDINVVKCFIIFIFYFFIGFIF